MESRRLLITGGTRGIGRAIASAFLARGAEVVVCGRQAPSTPVAVGGREATFVSADVREPEQVERLVSTAKERLGGIDVLINNAGGSPYCEVAQASPRFLEKIIQLNLVSPLLVSQSAYRVMQEQADGGVIVNIASVSGTRPSPGTAAYGAAKAGLINLTRSLAVEWAPKVRVNAIVAGLIETEQTELHYGDESAKARVAATVPLGRLGRMDEVAACSLFLASPLASYISGAAVELHGGGERPAFLDALAAPKEAT